MIKDIQTMVSTGTERGMLTPHIQNTRKKKLSLCDPRFDVSHAVTSHYTKENCQSTTCSLVANLFPALVAKQVVVEIWRESLSNLESLRSGTLASGRRYGKRGLSESRLLEVG